MTLSPPRVNSRFLILSKVVFRDESSRFLKILWSIFFHFVTLNTDFVMLTKMVFFSKMDDKQWYKLQSQHYNSIIRLFIHQCSVSRWLHIHACILSIWILNVNCNVNYQLYNYRKVVIAYMFKYIQMESVFVVICILFSLICIGNHKQLFILL